MGQPVQLSDLNVLPQAWRIRLADVLALLPSCRIVICYGSRWNGIPRPSSDYDMMLIGDKPLRDQEIVELRRSIKTGWPDVDWHWLSIKGARANRLINPTLNWIMKTGYVLGDVTLLGEPVPTPILSVLGAAQDVMVELEDLQQWDDPWGDDGREYRQLAKRLVVLEQTLNGIANSQKLSREVQHIMESPDVGDLLKRRTEQVIWQARHSTANARDRMLESTVHG
ncbi:MAG: hypothetical protein C7B47_08785 [Sulfobacillus thermosulfidooxidans]|uniref:Nucleotidyltransferase domain-containing protein n=1 Tax=Sulfobacillus thermosulfidooxidans TaxID=28034 RepID=A0A2T2WY40_SULTH|nr:MAG: hypothetical protein C7B47_08785 [Sulfobacillus thermosulfidooxidans]